MSLYDPERDPVRRAGRWLRWALAWVVLPAAFGLFLSGNVDFRSLPLVGLERESAVLFLDGQAYFGHLDDSGESGTLVLRDVYYFQDSKGGPSGLPVSLVRRGSEAHEPADGMRINRDRVLAVEEVRRVSAVSRSVEVERELAGMKAPLLALNRVTVAGPDALAAQRVAAEHDLARAYVAAADQLAKVNELVLPINKAEAQTITQTALGDLRTVRQTALAALASAMGMPAADADTYMRATDPLLEGKSFANEPGVLLAPHLDSIVNRATQAYAQVGDAAAKQLTQPRATPSPAPALSPAPSPSRSPLPSPSARP